MTKFLKDFFGQAHVTIDASTHEEASESAIMEKVTDASGTSVRVLKDETAGNREAGDRKVVGLQKKTAGNLEIRDRAGISSALADVRGGANGANWALILYDSPDSNNVGLAGTGSGGADELARFELREKKKIGRLLTLFFFCLKPFDV